MLRRLRKKRSPGNAPGLRPLGKEASTERSRLEDAQRHEDALVVRRQDLAEGVGRFLDLPLVLRASLADFLDLGGDLVLLGVRRAGDVLEEVLEVVLALPLV